MCVYYSVEEMRVLKSTRVEVRGQIKSHFSLAIMWVIKIKLGLSGLVAGTLAYGVPFLASHRYLFLWPAFFRGGSYLFACFPSPCF